MTMANETPEIDPTPALMTERIPPSGIAVLGELHENFIVNFKDGIVPNPQLPSLWRLAYVISYENAPLIFYYYQKDQR